MSDINLEEILRKKEFDELSDKTKKELIAISNQIKNKSSMEAFKIIGNFYNTTLKNEQLTPANKKALYLAITSSLDKKTKTQFDMLYESLLKKM